MNSEFNNLKQYQKIGLVITTAQPNKVTIKDTYALQYIYYLPIKLEYVVFLKNEYYPDIINKKISL